MPAHRHHAGAADSTEKDRGPNRSHLESITPCRRAGSCLDVRTHLLLLLLVVLVFVQTVAAGAGEVLPLWPGPVPGDFGDIGPERVRAPEEAPTRNAQWITNVKTPTLTVFRPASTSANRTAVVICPGGGYWNLAWDLEGEEVAQWLASAGVTGIVLKYRVPRRPGQPERLPAPGPLLDAQRAISLVRAQAARWEIDPQRIGIMGFSAGGHLALAAATHFDRRGYDPLDDIDRTNCRPDFAVAVYPGYLIEQESAGVEVRRDVLAPYMRIPEGTPPILLVHASDDRVAGSENSAVMYLALKRAGIPAELHIYARGGHGFGVRPTDLACSTWTDRCLAWLRDTGMLVTPGSAIPVTPAKSPPRQP